MILGKLLFRAVLVGASIMYQRSQHRKLQRQLEAEADKRKGFDFTIRGEAAPQRIAYGKCKVGGVAVKHRFVDDFNSATENGDSVFSKNFSNSSVGGTKQEFCFMSVDVCYGGKDGIEGVQNVLVNDIDYRGTTVEQQENNSAFQHRMIFHHKGGTACNTATANHFPITDRFPLSVHGTCMFRLNRDNPQYSGPPDLGIILKGMKVRTIIKNGDDYSFSTDRVYSNNSALVYLDYLTNEEIGAGVKDSDVDLKSFYEGAEVCSTIVSTNAPFAGSVNGQKTIIGHPTFNEFPKPANNNFEPYHADMLFYDEDEEKLYEVDVSGNYTEISQPLTGTMKLYECNVVLSSDVEPSKNLETIKATMGLANVSWNNKGQYKLTLSYPRNQAELDAATVETFETKDFLNHVITTNGYEETGEVLRSYPTTDEIVNQVVVIFQDEVQDFRQNSVTWPTSGSQAHQDFVAANGGNDYTSTIRLAGVTEKARARAYAERTVRFSQETYTIECYLSIKGWGLESGDIIKLTHNPSGIVEEYFQVADVIYHSGFTVKVVAEKFSLQTLAWNADDNIAFTVQQQVTNSLPNIYDLMFTPYNQVDESETTSNYTGRLSWSEIDHPINKYIVEMRKNVVSQGDDENWEELGNTRQTFFDVGNHRTNVYDFSVRGITFTGRMTPRAIITNETIQERQTQISVPVYAKSDDIANHTASDQSLTRDSSDFKYIAYYTFTGTMDDIVLPINSGMTFVQDVPDNAFTGFAMSGNWNDTSSLGTAAGTNGTLFFGRVDNSRLAEDESWTSLEIFRVNYVDSNGRDFESELRNLETGTTVTVWNGGDTWLSFVAESVAFYGDYVDITTGAYSAVAKTHKRSQLWTFGFTPKGTAGTVGPSAIAESGNWETDLSNPTFGWNVAGGMVMYEASSDPMEAGDDLGNVYSIRFNKTDQQNGNRYDELLRVRPGSSFSVIGDAFNWTSFTVSSVSNNVDSFEIFVDQMLSYAGTYQFDKTYNIGWNPSPLTTNVQHVAFVVKRSETQPGAPTTGEGSHNFNTGVTVPPSGWANTDNIPAGEDQLWVSTFSFFAPVGTSSVAAGVWSDAKPWGSIGYDGLDGTTIASIVAFQRSDSQPAKPTTGSWNFVSSSLTGLNNGWSATVPSGTTDLWVVRAYATTTDVNVSDSDLDWSTPIIESIKGENSTPVGINSAEWLDNSDGTPNTSGRMHFREIGNTRLNGGDSLDRIQEIRVNAVDADGFDNFSSLNALEITNTISVYLDDRNQATFVVSAAPTYTPSGHFFKIPVSVVKHTGSFTRDVNWRVFWNPRGEQGLPGIDGASYVVVFADDASGTNKSFTYTNQEYILYYEYTGAAPGINDVTGTWVKFKGEKGDKGQGIWKIYALDENGTSQSFDPTNRLYATFYESDDQPSLPVGGQTWIKVVGIDGTNGVDGTDGIDGQQSGVVVVYADDENGLNKSFTHTDQKFIKFHEYPGSTPPSLASITGTWVDISGVDGTNGTDGADGADGADGQSIWAIYATNSSGSSQSFTQGSREYVTFYESSTQPTLPVSGEVFVSYKGADGTDGADGAQGPQGPQGPAGNDGTNGTNGTNGTDGADGADGDRGAGWFRYETGTTSSTSGLSNSTLNSYFATATGLSPVAADRFIVNNNNDSAHGYIRNNANTGWNSQAAFIDGNLMVNGTVTASKIASNAITSGKIAADAITSAKIAANAIDASHISAGSITGDEISSSYVYAGALNADLITTGTLNANRLNLNGSTLSVSSNGLLVANGGIGTSQIAGSAVSRVFYSTGNFTISSVSGPLIVFGGFESRTNGYSTTDMTIQVGGSQFYANGNGSGNGFGGYKNYSGMAGGRSTNTGNVSVNKWASEDTHSGNGYLQSTWVVVMELKR